MKKQTAIRFAFLLIACALFFSCRDNKKKTWSTGSFEFDSIQTNTTAHLFGDTAKPACSLAVDLAFAARSSDPRLKDSLNACLLSFCLGSRYLAMQPEEAVEGYTRKYIDRYRSDLEPLYQKEDNESMPDVETWYSYYKRLQGNVQYYAKDLLVYRFHYEEYTGGAHGIYKTSFLNLDLRTMCPVRLDDLFAEGYEEPLTNLLWKQLMADNKVSSREELEKMGYGSTGELTPTENFCMSQAGITFHYNVYDIAPYVMGATEISLSWEIMEHLLTDRLQIMKSVR